MNNKQLLLVLLIAFVSSPTNALNWRDLFRKKTATPAPAGMVYEENQMFRRAAASREPEASGDTSRDSASRPPSPTSSTSGSDSEDTPAARSPRAPRVAPPRVPALPPPPPVKKAVERMSYKAKDFIPGEGLQTVEKSRNPMFFEKIPKAPADQTPALEKVVLKTRADRAEAATSMHGTPILMHENPMLGAGAGSSGRHKTTIYEARRRGTRTLSAKPRGN